MRKDGNVKIRLLTGVTVYVHHPGALPSILILESGTEEERGARVFCIRVDLERYRQMTVVEMIKAGLIDPAFHKRETEGAETEAGGAPADGRSPEARG